MIIDEKLKESLKGLFNGEIKADDLSHFFQQQGVLVDVHAGRVSGKASLNPKLYGFDISKDEELSSFRKEYVKDERISFLPLSLEKRFIAIEASTRTRQKNLAIGFEGRYMPINVFKEFSVYVKEQQSKYINAMEDVLSRWDELRVEFTSQLDTMFYKLGAVDKEELKRSILSKAPTMDEFKKSCKLEIEVSAFPMSQNLAILDNDISEDVKKTLEKKSLNTVYEILETILSDSFKTINSAMHKYGEIGFFKKPTLNSINKLKDRILIRNILNHPILNNLVSLLDISSCLDDDEIQERLEDSCVLIYAFAKLIELEDCIDINESFLEENVLQDLSLGMDL